MSSDEPLKCHIKKGVLIPGCIGVAAHNFEDCGTNSEIIKRYCTCNTAERPSYELLSLENEALKARLSVLEQFVRERVADRKTLWKPKAGFHSRRLLLEAEAILRKLDQ